MSDYDSSTNQDIADGLYKLAGEFQVDENPVVIQAYKRLYQIKESNWIAVGERLPELSGNYMVAMKQYDFGGRHVSTAGWNHINQCWSILDRRMEMYDVAFWMDIPTPPEPEINREK